MTWRNLLRRHGRPARPVVTSRLRFITLEQRITPARVPPINRGEPAALWTALAAVPDAGAGQTTVLNLEAFKPYALNAAVMSRLLSIAPAEGYNLAADSTTILPLPTPDGSLAHFRIVSVEMMEPGLAAQYPEIRTIRGQGVEDPTAVLSADITRLGFHAQVISPNGSYYVDPYWHLDTSLYAAYSRDDLLPAAGAAGPTPDDVVHMPARTVDDPTTGVVRSARSGTQLRTYRLANAATAEYTTFFGGTVANGQAAIVTAINRVSGIMETELSIRLTLVANNSSLVFTNTGTDGYTNNNPDALLDQNQAKCDTVIGNANYDIGHVFSTGGGGLATLGVVGIPGFKAQGETGSSSPVGDAFYIDFVIHEMGHQFNAEHTFNTSADSQRNATTAYEPGSGSTIMAYAGITGDDLQAHSDPYYHSISFDEIISYVDNTIPSVGSRTATGNLVPSVNGGSNFTIPTGTPFALTATGSDGNGDTLTYSWEERDLGVAQLLTSPDNGSSPIFRSFTGTTNPTRTFPRLSAILNGTNASLGEKLPAVARSLMRFRVTVRDNRAGGGGVNTDDVTLTVVNTGSAFSVTSPNSSLTWTGGSQQTVSWNVAGTSGGTINAPLVNIRLSTNGGNTFPILLATGTANDGSETITVPGDVPTSSARIKVEPTNNVFFDISNANFSITAAPVPPPTVAGIQVNDGSAERSEVRSLTVTFSTQVNVAGSPFSLTRIGGGPVGLAMGAPTLDGQGRTTVRLKFTGTDEIDPQSLLNGGEPSLADGRYQLTIADGFVNSATTSLFLDGDGNGSAGGLYQSPLDTAGSGAGHFFGLYRLFGDADGNGVVDLLDLGQLRSTFNVSAPDPGYLDFLDADNNGTVDLVDLSQFRRRFNGNVFV